MEHTFIWGDVGHVVDFPNKKNIHSELKQMGFKWYHITGIKEVSKEDFETYYKESL